MVLLLQQRRGMTAAELASELQVSERTITRDVGALSEAGIPVYADRGRAGGYRLLGGYRTGLTGLGREEAEALFLSGVPGALRDMGLAEPASAAALKVSAALNPDMRDAQQNVARRFHLDAPGWWRTAQSPPWLPLLTEAVWEDRQVTVRYQRGRRPSPPAPRGNVSPGSEPHPTKGQEVLRELEPYGLVLKAGVWYLAARPVRGERGERHSAHTEGGTHRIYRVERILEVTVAQEQFERQLDFDLPTFWAEQSAAFARSVLRESVLLRLSPAGARRLPYVHGDREAVQAALRSGLSDARGWLTVTLPVEDQDVAFGQLMGLGPDVEVLQPVCLRDRFRQAARRMGALYDRSGPADSRGQTDDGQR